MCSLQSSDFIAEVLIWSPTFPCGRSASGTVYRPILRPALSVPFHHCSILIHPTTTHAVNCFSPSTSVSPVSITPPILHTHSFVYHRRCIMFFSQHFSFPCQCHSTNVPYSFIHLSLTLIILANGRQRPLHIPLQNPFSPTYCPLLYWQEIHKTFLLLVTCLQKCWQLIFEISDKQPPPEGKLHLTSRNKITFPIFNFNRIFVIPHNCWNVKETLLSFIYNGSNVFLYRTCIPFVKSFWTDLQNQFSKKSHYMCLYVEKMFDFFYMFIC